MTKCCVTWCTRDAVKGRADHCGACYKYLYRHGTTDRAPRKLPRGECVQGGCTAIVSVVKLGLCALHYSRYKAGQELGEATPQRILGDDKARFWSYVEVRGRDECWPWTGATTDGRGYFGVGGKTVRVTRFLLGIIDGVDIEGLDVCHTCDNPNCVNRRHLFPGTRQVNVQDMDTKGRRVNANEKVTPRFVRDMRHLHESGRSPAELARTYGVNCQTMYDLVTRRTWKAVG